uniref:Origin recognition complex subunit 6 n=1 Tax=Eutreptiella gymnastica TaxID=73025 RepID=A0A6U8HBD9_9EUGL|mmetsp:Transcript_53333/g.95204  ORF Transcript_53333/g.95204 Transcript_53333/m.95204 type:complete len:347 (+) Transcript_53333:59-1099(+)
MNIEQGAQRLNVTDKKVLSKAEEYLRLLVVKCKTRGLAAEAELAKPMVCLDLACQLLGQDYQRDQLIKYSGTGEKEYQTAFGMIQSVLKIKMPVSLQQLAIKFGCARIQSAAQRNLQAFQVKFRGQLNHHQRASLNFRSSAYPACALYLTALKEKLKVDKDRLLLTVNCLPETFDSVCTQWIELFPNLKPPELVRKEQQLQKLKDKALKDKTNTGDKPTTTFVDTGKRRLPTDGIHAPAAPDDQPPKRHRARSPEADGDPSGAEDVVDASEGSAPPPPPAPRACKRTNSELFDELCDRYGADGPSEEGPWQGATAASQGAPPQQPPPPPPPPTKKLKQATLSFGPA